VLSGNAFCANEVYLIHPDSYSQFINKSFKDAHKVANEMTNNIFPDFSEELLSSNSEEKKLVIDHDKGSHNQFIFMNDGNKYYAQHNDEEMFKGTFSTRKEANDALQLFTSLIKNSVGIETASKAAKIVGNDIEEDEGDENILAKSENKEEKSLTAKICSLSKPKFSVTDGSSSDFIRSNLKVARDGKVATLSMSPAGMSDSSVPIPSLNQNDSDEEAHESEVFGFHKAWFEIDRK